MRAVDSHFALAEHVGEKYFRVHAMRGIVWARVNAAWFFRVCAEIAGSGFLLDDRFLAARVFGVVRQHFKRMQIDVAVGTIARAGATADAPIRENPRRKWLLPAAREPLLLQR